MPESPPGLLALITALFFEHRYRVVFAGSAGDNLGISATGDVVMLVGGWPSNVGHTALGLVMLVGALGALAADNLSWGVGRAGRRVLVVRISKNACSPGWSTPICTRP